MSFTCMYEERRVQSTKYMLQHPQKILACLANVLLSAYVKYKCCSINFCWMEQSCKPGIPK